MHNVWIVLCVADWACMAAALNPDDDLDIFCSLAHGGKETSQTH